MSKLITLEQIIEEVINRLDGPITRALKDAKIDSGKITKQLKQYGNIDGVQIYLGPIKDNDFVRKVKREVDEREFKMKNDEIKVLNKIIVEIDSPFYFNINKLNFKT